MAEGFARAYGSDVLTCASAGLSPALSVAPLTHKVMLEKNIDVGYVYPKNLAMLKGSFDLIVNMSGQALPANVGARVEEWTVRDPIGEPEEVYREVRDVIEQNVLQLVETMRSRKPPQSEEPAARVDTRRHAPGQ
jgi:arsenate reductase